MRGNCYVTCEALYHLLGGKAAGWVPVTMKHEGDTHWWLEQYSGGYVYVGPHYRDGRSIAWRLGTKFVTRLDPTVSQFKTLPDYSKGRRRGFLTKFPSKQAKALMDQMVWQRGER